MSVNDNLFVVMIAAAIAYGTPLVFAALGEILAERSGVINLGVEGMMLLGAVGASWIATEVSGPAGVVLPVALIVAMLFAAAGALIHAFLTITLRVNQIISGLALTIFAGIAGVSSYLAGIWDLGQGPVPNQFDDLNLFGLARTPVLGPILFEQTALTYLSWLAVIGVSIYLVRTRLGLQLRAVGESPQTADSVGVNVVRTRYVHV
ncbi:MAG: ABC transporter permease, partial [Actinomycetota bacterium]